MVIVYRYRDWLAVLPSAALIALLVAGGLRDARPLKPKYDEPVKLEFVEPPPVLPQPVPPVPRPEARPEPLKQVQQAKPEPRPEPKQPIQPKAQPAPEAPTEPAPRSEPVQKAVAPPTAQPPAASPPVPSAAPRANAEAEFIGKVRAYLNSVKRYPTGREASLQRPEGTVKVWFVLRRDGSVVDVGIEESSNAMLLDQAARKSVNLGQFPAFPEQFRPGEVQHRFVVDLQFKPGGG